MKQRDIFTLQMRNWDIEMSRLNLTWHAYIWIYFWMQSPWAAIYFNCIWTTQHMWKSLSTCLRKDIETMIGPENGLRKFSSTKHEVCISMETENVTVLFGNHSGLSATALFSVPTANCLTWTEGRRGVLPLLSLIKSVLTKSLNFRN